MMDHLMAEKLTKIIKTAKWGKSHQKNIKFLRVNRKMFVMQDISLKCNQVNVVIKLSGFHSIEICLRFKKALCQGPANKAS